MLSNEQINALAHDAGQNQTQRQRIVVALRAANTLLAADRPLQLGQAPDGLVEEAIPGAPVVVCVSSTPKVSAQDYRELWPRLTKAKDTFGRIEVVTFGGRGNELHAHKWAKEHGMTVREFGEVWNVPNADRTTRRDARPFATRDTVLQAYLAKAERVYALLYGDPGTPAYRAAQIVHANILKWHPLSEQGAVDVPVVAPVVEDDPYAALGLEDAIA